MPKYTYIRHKDLPTKITTCTKGSDEICKKINKNQCCQSLEVIDELGVYNLALSKSDQDKIHEIKKLGEQHDITFPVEKHDEMIYLCGEIQSLNKITVSNKDGLYYFTGAPILYRSLCADAYVLKLSVLVTLMSTVTIF